MHLVDQSESNDHPSRKVKQASRFSGKRSSQSFLPPFSFPFHFARVIISRNFEAKIMAGEASSPVLEKERSRDDIPTVGRCHSVTNDGEFRLPCDGSLRGPHLLPHGRVERRGRGTRKQKGRLLRGSALIVHRLAQDRLEDKWGSTSWKARLLLNVPS